MAEQDFAGLPEKHQPFAGQRESAREATPPMAFTVEASEWQDGDWQPPNMTDVRATDIQFGGGKGAAPAAPAGETAQPDYSLHDKLQAECPHDSERLYLCCQCGKALPVPARPRGAGRAGGAVARRIDRHDQSGTSKGSL